MAEARCYHCGHDNVLDDSTALTQCTGCGQPLHPQTARRIAAIARLTQAARAEADLDEGTRKALLAFLERNRHDLIATTRAVPPPVPEPPPLPVMPPPLPAARVAPAVTDPADPVELQDPEPPPRLKSPIPPLGPTLWSRLGPLFSENLLFALAGFLLVAGAVYFTTTAWTTMSGSAQKLVVAGGLLLFAAVTHGAGVVLGKEPSLRSSARVLSLVAMALVPAASAVAGLLFALSPASALAAAAVAAAAGHGFLSALARREGQAMPRGAVWLFAAMVFAGVFAPTLWELRLSASCAAAGVPILMAWLLRRKRSPTTTVPAALACALLASMFAALAFALGIAIAHGPAFAMAIAPLGVVVAAAALAAVILESAEPQRAPAALTTALAVAISAVLMASGDLRCVMIAAWLAAAASLQISLRLDRARLLLPALVLSAVGYLFLPAPIRELAAELRAEAASQLGYAPERLPLSFYGITFLPYLLLLALLGMWFRRTGRSSHRRVCSSWGISVAAGLAAMSLLLGRDLRAPMAVLPADGLLLVLLGYLSQSAAAVLAGCLGVVGGIVCLLIWCEAPAGAIAAVGSGAALVFLLLARRPAASDTFATRAQQSYLHAATITVVALAIFSLRCVWPLEAQGAGNLLHATVLLPLLLLLRWPASPLQNAARQLPFTTALLLLPVLCAITTGLAVLLDHIELLGLPSMRTAMPLALAMVTVASHGLLPLLSETDSRRTEHRAIACGMFALHLWLVPDLIAGYTTQTFLGSTLIGTAALALSAGWLAVRVRLEALLAIAILEGTFPLHLLAGVWLGNTAGPPGLVGPAALALVAGLLAARRPMIAAAASAIATVAATSILVMRLGSVPAVPSTRDALATLAVAVLLIVIPALRARRLRPGDSAIDLSHAAVGTVVAVLGPIALLDLLVGPSQNALRNYAIGMLSLAAGAFAISRIWQPLRLWWSIHGLGHVAFATLLLFLWRPIGEPETQNDHLVRLALFATAAVLAVACRPRALRTLATLVTAAAALGATVLEPLELRWLPRDWWSVLALAFCAVALALAAVPRWSARALAVRLFALPTVILAAAISLVWGLVMAIAREPRSAADLALVDARAMALLAAGVALAANFGSRWRFAIAVAAVAIAAVATIPLQGLLHGGRNISCPPDAEVALLAVVVAVGGRLYPRGASWLVALIAILFTGFELPDLSTPVTMTLLAAVPLALLMRRLPGPHAALHGALLIVATWSWIGFAMADQPALPLGPWLALATALLGMAISPWLQLVSASPPEKPQLLAVRAFGWVATLSALLATCAVTKHAMPLPDRLPDLLAALAASALVAIGSMRAARAPGQAPLVHLGLAAIITAYWLFAAGTDLLTLLHGRHHHVLYVLGATLFLVAGHRPAEFHRQLRAAAVVTPLLAILMAISFGGLTFALLAGAMVIGLGAVVARVRWLGALALMLANSGLFHLWLHQGVFDPSFYGVPAGLSLVFGAELARRALGDARVLALRVTGLAVLYGSVLIQIARVSVPLHALVLFVLAMAAVAYGAMRRKTAILVTGVTAVVLDVVVYLAQRGFEQDFLGSMLLVFAGGGLFVIAARSARRRANAAPPAE